ncbi:hypothetical protein PYCC9005_003228 [Savitreella phatthalungensis]
MESVKSAVNTVLGKGKVLMILSSANTFSDGKPTGWYLPEAAHPYFEFVDAGYEVDFASPKGGEAPLDPSSIEPFIKDDVVAKFYNNQEHFGLTKKTTPLIEIQHTNYKAAFVVGGHGANLDLPTDPNLVELLEKFWAAGKPVSAVCHGPAALVNVKDLEGQSIFKGRKATTFTNEEEEQVKMTHLVPFSAEDRIKQNGGEFQSTKPWGEFAVRDGQLVTGQNPASAAKTGKLVIEAIEATK